MRARMAPGLTQATIVTVPRTAPDLPASSIASRLAVSMPTNSQPWMPAVTSTRGPLSAPPDDGDGQCLARHLDFGEDAHDGFFFI